MELRDSFEWRGLGSIPRSGLRLRDEFAAWDAERRYTVPGMSVPDHKACQCGQVLRGLVKPWECKVFGTACTPERPIGTCMVSSEGRLRGLLPLRAQPAEERISIGIRGRGGRGVDARRRTDRESALAVR